MSKLDHFKKLDLIFKRQFSLSSVSNARKPPKEEFMNNPLQTRKRTSNPFDRRWKWTPKSAEPYNVKGGHIEWTKMKFLHRGVQMPGYFDPKTDRFIFVEEAVPEIIVPDLKDFELKPYVSYNAAEVNNEVFDARKLYEKTLEKEILQQVSTNKTK